jgi:Restriction endonuclease
MPVLDFTEIPSAKAGSDRDQFELFAREFLQNAGLSVIVGPDRGADAGRDLVVEEIRTGIVGETRVRWLVSCKHKAHSGNSVTPDDEQDIQDRVNTHDCQGFIGFYSTIMSSGLAAKLNAPRLPFGVKIFDREAIERQLLTPSEIGLARRFFPLSFAKWLQENPRAAKIFSEDSELNCAYCKKSLLHPNLHGIIVVWTSKVDGETERTEGVYWCCKGQCDKALQQKYRQKHNSDSCIDGWEDIPDLIVPVAYVRMVITTLNDFHRGMKYSDEAFENMRKFLMNLFPLVSRETTTNEKEHINDLSMIPAYLGGWGYERH